MKIFFLPIILMIAGCVSIERDIYFKDANGADERTIDAIRPSQQFRSDPVNIGDTGQPAAADTTERKIVLSIVNYADGSYFWGVIVPIVPVFFLPDMHFHLTKNEPLQVRCEVVPFFGSQYMKKSDIGRNLYALNEKGVEIAEKLRNKKDKCTSLKVVLPNGLELSPRQNTSERDQTTFSFDIAAADLNWLQIHVSEIQVDSGKRIPIDVRFHAVLEDWTRYHMPRLAP